MERSALSVSDEERNAIYEAAWQEGGFKFLLATFNDIALDRRANDTASEFIRNKIREMVKDPAVAEKLVPVDHPFTSKRPLIDTNYFETYNRDNVTLVDIRHAPIQEITPTGIRTADDEYELDVIVFATGFDAMTGPFNRMDIQGKDGRKLKDKWEHGPLTYLGVSSVGLPEPVHDHRPRLPVGAVEHAGVDRAARRVDRRRHRAHAGRGHRRRWRPTSRPRPSGSPTSTRSPPRRCSCSPTPGTSAPTSRASRGCSCRTSVASAPYRAEVRRGRATPATRASRLSATPAPVAGS